MNMFDNFLNIYLESLKKVFDSDIYKPLDLKFEEIVAKLNKKMTIDIEQTILQSITMPRTIAVVQKLNEEMGDDISKITIDYKDQTPQQILEIIEERQYIIKFEAVQQVKVLISSLMSDLDVPRLRNFDGLIVQHFRQPILYLRNTNMDQKGFTLFFELTNYRRLVDISAKNYYSGIVRKAYEERLRSLQEAEQQRLVSDTGKWKILNAALAGGAVAILTVGITKMAKL